MRTARARTLILAVIAGAMTRKKGHYLDDTPSQSRLHHRRSRGVYRFSAARRAALYLLIPVFTAVIGVGLPHVVHAQAPAQSPPIGMVELGGMDFDGYCRSQGHRGVGRDGSTAWSWNCTSTSGAKVPIQSDAVCRWQYRRSDAVSRYLNFNDPYSWRCYAPPTTFVPAPPSSPSRDCPVITYRDLINPVIVPTPPSQMLEVARGRLDRCNRAESWWFTANAGDEVIVAMWRNSDDLDSFLHLWFVGSSEDTTIGSWRDLPGTEIESDDDDGGHRNAFIRRRLSQTGLYRIVARPYDVDTSTGFGDYALSVILIRGGGGQSDLGGLDIERWCRDHGKRFGRFSPSDGYWRCTDVEQDSGGRGSIGTFDPTERRLNQGDLDQVCRDQYRDPRAYARQRDPNNSYSWYCRADS